MYSTKTNDILRNIKNKIDRKLLKNTDFSLFAINCNGGFILHDLGLKFNSPCVNLWMYPKDFIKYVGNLKHYSQCKMKFIDNDKGYPVGQLDDIIIYFTHYHTEKDALEKWKARTKRINYDDIFVLMTDRDGCTYEDLQQFDKLPYKKAVFTSKRYDDIKSAIYIKEFSASECVGDCFAFKNRHTGKKYYDALKYVKWFNSSLK